MGRWPSTPRRSTRKDSEYGTLFASAEDQANREGQAADRRRTQAQAYSDDELYGLLFGGDDS